MTRDQIIGERWRLGELLHGGTMGSLFAATHLHTEAPAVVKLMAPAYAANPTLRERFRQEAAVTANIQSDHIVRILDAGRDLPTGTLFIVMERLIGEDGAARLKRRGRLCARVAFSWMQQVGWGLDRAHARRVVHRDLKPSNLFVTARDDGAACVKILDFGIAKIAALAGAETTVAAGTPLYMSPEQIRGDGDIGPAADRYALCHVTYHLIVGEAYWQHQVDHEPRVYRLLQKVCAGGGPPPSSLAYDRCGVTLPPAFDAWFRRGTALQPEKRPAQLEEMVSQLERALGVAAGPPPAAHDQ